MNRVLPLALLVCVAAAGVSAAGQDGAKYRAPRTPDGRPDLQGVWSLASGVPLQRPSKFATRKFFTKEEFTSQRSSLQRAFRTISSFAPVEAVALDWADTDLYVDDLRTSLITYPENGKLPALMDGVRRLPSLDDFIAVLNDPNDGPPGGLFALIAAFGGTKRESHLDFTLFERCLTAPSVPFLPNTGENYLQIVQGRDDIALVTDDFRRVVSLDGTRTPGNRARSLAGTSVGRWEGDTLVVETKNFDERAPSFAGAGNAREKAVVERFTRTSDAAIDYSATVVDPATFKERIEMSLPMGRTGKRIFEAACHEGNYALPNTLSAARKEERDGK